MIDFWFPKWLKVLFSKYPKYGKLTTDNLNELRQRLKQFDVENPLVSIVIPAWNEEENILQTLASLAHNEFDFSCELIVVNNNSTDNTQAVLDMLGVRTLLETNQGIAPTRRKGLLASRGKYHLCGDSDTIYPPTWIKTMTTILQNNEDQGVACIYGAYSFIPSGDSSRFVMGFYEMAGVAIRLFKSKKNEVQRVMGFNFGFNRAVAVEVNGFIMDKPRKFRNEFGSKDYVGKSEDGVMAGHIQRAGYKLLFVNNKKSSVWTSDRRLMIDGGLKRAIKLRLKKLFNYKMNFYF